MVPSASTSKHFCFVVVEVREKCFSETVSDTHTVVVRKRSFCVLHSEVFILATSPQGLHFIVIIWICIRVAAEGTTFKTIYNTSKTLLIGEVYHRHWKNLFLFFKIMLC